MRLHFLLASVACSRFWLGLGFGSRVRVGPGCLSPRYEPEQRENEQDKAVARHLDAHELRQRGEAREVEAVSVADAEGAHDRHGELQRDRTWQGR